jgi:hypothetical protein
MVTAEALAAQNGEIREFEILAKPVHPSVLLERAGRLVARA